MNIIGIKIMPTFLASCCNAINCKLLANELQKLQIAIHFCIAEKK